jgi:hypothetical protein
LHAVLRGIDVARVDVFPKVGVTRFTMDKGCGKAEPCIVAFQVPVTIHK